jgi:hypothetical protein
MPIMSAPQHALGQQDLDFCSMELALGASKTWHRCAVVASSVACQEGPGWAVKDGNLMR